MSVIVARASDVRDGFETTVHRLYVRNEIEDWVLQIKAT